MGIDPEKLYFVSKKEYLNNYHPDLKQACKEVQDARYDHFEKKRQDRINQAKEFRNDLIKKENDSKSNSKTNSKENKSYYSKEATSTAIQREKEKLGNEGEMERCWSEGTGFQLRRLVLPPGRP